MNAQKKSLDVAFPLLSNWSLYCRTEQDRVEHFLKAKFVGSWYYGFWIRTIGLLWRSTSPITNISSIQVHSRNEAEMRRCSSIASMTMMQYTGMCLGEGMFEKNTQGDQGMLGYHPPPGCSRFRAIFPVGIFSEVYRALPGRKNEFFTSVFSVVFLVLLAVSRTARCDACHTSLASIGDFI